MGVLCLVNTVLIIQTGFRLYCAADQKCDCLPQSCCRNTDHTLYRSYMTEFWQRFTLFALMVGCWVMEVVSWLVGPADSELWALTDTLNTFQGVFIFITFLRSSKKRRLLQEALARAAEGVGGRGGVGGSISTLQCLPAAASPNRIMDRIKDSSSIRVLVRWFSRLPGRGHRIATPQVLDNIIFRGKMEYNEGFEEDVSEEQAEDGAGKGVRDGDGVKRFKKGFEPVFTSPQHWRVRWSRSYFPGAPQGTGAAHGGLPGVMKGLELASTDTTTTGATTSSATATTATATTSAIAAVTTPTIATTAVTTTTTTAFSSFASPSPSCSSPSSSSSFARWSLLRHKSGSMTLVSAPRQTPAGDVVCRGLTRTDPGLP
ncbi:uncharacterized protein LOC126997913 isoform X2 [Eriocheir sinensis]|uniref:uncharacterized protein LOC126997913 isoform X2 n=1 Tax=Eriocheir sinensis TaxID=95602 RepID=UPI0021C9470C|nr:uncharacterized protein LOC126997913 isoform X2 [Eriocheir sinensis]XP_050715090.1 uncharacterized protein LOC126997913 isoform X2 [Eriocheir sinensis]